MKLYKFLGRIFFLVGWGISAHDFAHQVWELKGTVFSLEGGYIGLALVFIGYLLLEMYISRLKKRK
jgi:hypothetical protein